MRIGGIKKVTLAYFGKKSYLRIEEFIKKIVSGFSFGDLEPSEMEKKNLTSYCNS